MSNIMKIVVTIGFLLFVVLVLTVIKCIYYLHTCKIYGKDMADELQEIYKKMNI